MALRNENPEWVGQMLSQYTHNARIAEILTILVADDTDLFSDFIESSLTIATRAENIQWLPRLWAEMEVLHSESPETMFRENSVRLKGLQMYCSQVADSFFKKLVKPLKKTMKSRGGKLQDPETLALAVLNAMKEMQNEIPTRVVSVFGHVESLVKKKFPDAGLEGIVGVALFLYFITPCVCNPHSFGITSKPIRNPAVLRTLARTGKEIQQIVNRVMLTGGKVQDEGAVIVRDFIGNIGKSPGVEVQLKTITDAQFAAAEATLAELLLKYSKVLQASTLEDALANLKSRKRKVFLLDQNTDLKVPSFCRVPEVLMQEMLVVERLVMSYFSGLDVSTFGMQSRGRRYIPVATTFLSKGNDVILKRMFFELGKEDAVGVIKILTKLQNILLLLPFLAHTGFGRFNLINLDSDKLEMAIQIVSSDVTTDLLLEYIRGWLTTAWSVKESGKTVQGHAGKDNSLFFSADTKKRDGNSTDAEEEKLRPVYLSKLKEGLHKRIPSLSPSGKCVVSFDFNAKEGSVTVKSQNYILLHTGILGRLAYVLGGSQIHNESVAALLGCWGLCSGMTTGSNCFSGKRDLQYMSQEEVLPQIMFKMGFGKYHLRKTGPDWILLDTMASFESAHRLEKVTFAPQSSPACMFTAQFLGGFLSQQTGTNLACCEVQCMGLGHRQCSFVVADVSTVHNYGQLVLSLQKEDEPVTLGFGFFHEIEKAQKDKKKGSFKIGKALMK